MKNYCNECEYKKVDHCRQDIDNQLECHKYKQKSDELYMTATYMQEDIQKISCEARDLEAHAKELEYQAKQLCAQANIAWSHAHKLEDEVSDILDLASFYCNKAIDCYKNMNNNTPFRPTCSSEYECTNINHYN